MRRAILTILLLAISLFCLIQNATTQAIPNLGIDVNTLINNLERAKQGLKSFKGILRASGPEGDVIYEVFSKEGDKLYAISKDSSLIVFQNGDVGYSYSSATNTVVKTTPSVPQYPSMQSFLYSLVNALRDDKYEHRIEIDGNRFYKIEILSKDEQKKYKWFYWVSNDNWLVYKQEAYVYAGGFTIKIIHQWDDIIIDEEIPDSKLEFQIPEGATVITQ